MGGHFSAFLSLSSFSLGSGNVCQLLRVGSALAGADVKRASVTPFMNVRWPLGRLWPQAALLEPAALFLSWFSHLLG